MRTHDNINKLSENTIAITGGAGFIGSYLVETLIAQGKNVQVIDNLSSGNLSNIKGVLNNERLKFFKCDLSKSNRIDEIIEDSEVIFHLAANPQVRLDSNSNNLLFQNNLYATYQLLEAMRRSDVEALIFTSSSTVYGDAKILPTPESYLPLQPISLYGAMKLASESLISSYAHIYGFKVAICRLANIIGPRANKGVVFDFVRKLQANPKHLEILGDGKQTKSYLYISDCIESLLLAYTRSHGIVEIFNVGSDDQIPVTEIAQIVSKAMDIEDFKQNFTGGVDGGRGWTGDVKNMLLDTKRLKRLGWKPKWSSAEAVRLTVKEQMKEINK